MINLGKLFLPKYINYKWPEENEEIGKITFRRPGYGTDDYTNNSQCSLYIQIQENIAFIDYYCEDDMYLSELLDLDDQEPFILQSYITCGDLTKETFENIQSRALKILCEYADDSHNELLEYFDNL